VNDARIREEDDRELERDPSLSNLLAVAELDHPRYAPTPRSGTAPRRSTRSLVRVLIAARPETGRPTPDEGLSADVKPLRFRSPPLVSLVGHLILLGSQGHFTYSNKDGFLPLILVSQSSSIPFPRAGKERISARGRLPRQSAITVTVSSE
jgi:hypothetical protein